MPQYLYNIGGKRHVFEGPDPRTTAQFARRWAAARTSAQAAANDNRPELGPMPSQFALDIGARAKQDVADLTGAIDQVRSHPTDIIQNAPRILTAVARYVPNALGLAPAARVDQITRPLIRGINSRFGTHIDPRYATDQILNWAGLLSGVPEAMGIENSVARAGETFAPKRISPAAAEHPGVTAEPQLIAPRPKANPTPAYPAPDANVNSLGLNSAGEYVVPLDDEFLYKHQQRMESLPKHLQNIYRTTVEDNIVNPILDSSDYRGHNATAVQSIISRLATIADQRRVVTGNSRVADALDDANADFRLMVYRQQPRMARELGFDEAMGPRPPSRGNAAQAAPFHTVRSAPQPTPTNAFSGAASSPENLVSTPVPPTPNQVDGLSFNAMHPLRWLGPSITGLANQPQIPPQN